jgi:SAM-dependent methyltransferase
MLARGWTITGCDLASAMLERAASKSGNLVELLVADMRELPILGKFDLVWALDDALNYLLDVAELEEALAGMRENLAYGGLLVFDVNELAAYRSFYAATHKREAGALRFTWTGLSPGDAKPGATFEARLDVEAIDGRTEVFEPSIHRQRHFPEKSIRGALANTDLECLDVFGHGLDGIPSQPLDPAVHTKAIYVARCK